MNRSHVQNTFTKQKIINIILYAFHRSELIYLLRLEGSDMMLLISNKSLKLGDLLLLLQEDISSPRRNIGVRIVVIPDMRRRGRRGWRGWRGWRRAMRAMM